MSVDLRERHIIPGHQQQLSCFHACLVVTENFQSTSDTHNEISCSLMHDGTGRAKGGGMGDPLNTRY